MSDIDVTRNEVEEFREDGADEQLVVVEEFVHPDGETIERETKVARFDDGGALITQSDQTFEQIYLGEEATNAVQEHLDREQDDVRTDGGQPIPIEAVVSCHTCGRSISIHIGSADEYFAVSHHVPDGNPETGGRYYFCPDHAADGVEGLIESQKGAS